jgi:hypothetical protein
MVIINERWCLGCQAGCPNSVWCVLDRHPTKICCKKKHIDGNRTQEGISHGHKLAGQGKANKGTEVEEGQESAGLEIRTSSSTSNEARAEQGGMRLSSSLSAMVS